MKCSIGKIRVKHRDIEKDTYIIWDNDKKELFIPYDICDADLLPEEISVYKLKVDSPYTLPEEFISCAEVNLYMEQHGADDYLKELMYMCTLILLDILSSDPHEGKS